MSRNETLRLAVADTLQAVEGVVEQASQLNWSAADGFLPLIQSAILKRQHECLSVAVDLVDKSQGFAAVALLRPACEEFLWTTYLAKLQRPDAEQLLVLMGKKEISDSLKAQDGYAGKSVSKALGLNEYITNSEASSKYRAAQIKKLGAKLKWEKRTVEGGQLPSVSFIAKSVGKTDLYKYLYHASSRYVHFSPSELLRRTWGKTGNVTVASSHFADYWGAFVMYWGVNLLASTYAAICELSGEDGLAGSVDVEKLMTAAARIQEHGAVPIITSEELIWEPAPN